jgi:hypothetical protein
MTGETAFDLDDLQAIAAVLGIEVGDLIPRTERGSARDFDQAPAERTVTIGQGFAGRTDGVSRPPQPTPAPHPFSQPKPGPSRPVSAVPARKRRPSPVRPGNRPATR